MYAYQLVLLPHKTAPSRGSTCKRLVPRQCGSTRMAAEEQGTNEYKILRGVPYSSSTVALFQRNEAGWDSTATGTQFTLENSAEAVSAVIMEDDDVRGLIGLGTAHLIGNDTYFISDVVIARKHRRRSIGGQIITKLIQQCEQLG